MSKTLKIKIFLTIFVLGILILGGTTVHATTVTNATEMQTALGGAINAEVSENTVKLLQDITLGTGSEIDFTSGTVIIDLNGKTITTTVNNDLFNITGGDLTVKDSTNTTGKIDYTAGDAQIFYVYKAGKLTIENGIFNNTNDDIIGVDSDDTGVSVPTVVLNNGTFTADSTCVWGYAGNITINNGKYTSTNDDTFYFDSDSGVMNVTINNCEANGYYDVFDIEGGNITINNGKFTATKENTLYIENYYNDYGENNKLIINGGIYSSLGTDYPCIDIDMYEDTNPIMNVIINGGTFTAEEGAYDAITLDEGNLEINGGTFLSKSECGVAVYEGTLVITGGTFSGKWSGLWYDTSITDVTLKGGKFESLATVVTDNYGGICTDIISTIKPTEALATGYEFYEDDTIVEYDGYYCTKSPVTVELHRYNITINESENGTATIGKNYAVKNETITVTTTPSDGYKLKSITVTTTSGANVEVSNNKFTMPEEDIIVKTEFEKVEQEKDDTPKTGTTNIINYVILAATIIGVGMITLKKKEQ